MRWPSGQAAEEFASRFDFEASTLRYWASRLKTQAAAAAKPAPTVVRVVRRRSPAQARPAATDEPAVEVIVGPGRIVVRRGFDAELLRQVAAALEGARAR